MTKGRWITIGFLASLVALIIFARLTYSGKAPVSLTPDNCNSELWKHVGEPERLHVIERCTAVEGRVVSTHKAMDGDLHIGLDPNQRSVLNLMNVFHMRQELVVEIICDHEPSEKDAVRFCAGFVSTVTIPAVGDRVRVTGAYVTDSDNGWNEIHPVTRIEILGK